MKEIELKFHLDAEGVRRLRARIKDLQGLEAPPVTRMLHSVYHDTPDQSLRRAGIALRMRRDGRRWIQTVKAKTTRDGPLQSGIEDEAAAPGGKLNLNLIRDRDLRNLLADLTRDAPLSPICENAIRRTACILQDAGGTSAEIALDRGEIIAGDRAAHLDELEIELKSGSVGALFDIAQMLLPEGGVTFSRMSKAARGYLLAERGVIEPPLAPRTARPVALTRDQTSETAARVVLRECFEQIAQNIDAVRALDDPEGPHQLRVGLRRLRSAFAVFRSALASAEMERLEAEARWLGQQVGRQRDLDVARADLVAPGAAAHPDEPGFGILATILRDRAAIKRAGLRTALTGRRAHSFLFDLGRFIEARGWRAPGDTGRTARLARPVRETAVRALDLAWAKTCKRADGIEALDVEARHDLRKQLKKLRYSVEFLSPVLPRKRARAFLKRLKTLQEVFGDLNDVAMAQAQLLGAGAPGARDPDAQRAVGLLLGNRMARAETHWTEARALWAALAKAPRCW